MQSILTFCINPFSIGVLNAVSVIFFKSSLNIIINFLLIFDGFKWNFPNFKLDTLSLFHPNFMAIGHTVTKLPANKCRSLCELISNSIHANLGQANDRIAMKLNIIDGNEYYNHRSCFKKFGEDWSCKHSQISRGLTKERATSHKHCQLRPCLSCLQPDKASNIQLMDCSNASHLTAKLHFDTFLLCN